MDVARFLQLINREELYFARLVELDDPWEGSWAHSDPIFSNDPEYTTKAVQCFNHQARVSCWHENHDESVAMWSLYLSGREGVAIKTTVERLGYLTSADREVKISRVTYEGNQQVPPDALHYESGGYVDSRRVLNGERAIFEKRRGYQHEREIRAVVYDNFSAEQALAACHPDNFVNGSRHNTPTNEMQGGIIIPVDLSRMIDQIVVSPGFPRWALSSLQKAVDAASIPTKVRLSSLLEQPEIGLRSAYTPQQ